MPNRHGVTGNLCHSGWEQADTLMPMHPPVFRPLTPTAASRRAAERRRDHLRRRCGLRLYDTQRWKRARRRILQPIFVRNLQTRRPHHARHGGRSCHPASG